MNRKLYFCKSWFRDQKRPTELWTEEQARAAYEAKEPFTVLVDSIEKPYCFIEVAEKSVAVGFLDRLQRENTIYVFQDVEPGKMFLSRATIRDFVGDTHKLKVAETFRFAREGSVEISRRTEEPQQFQTKTNAVDVSGNFEAKPAFGEYESVIRIDR